MSELSPHEAVNVFFRNGTTVLSSNASSFAAATIQEGTLRLGTSSGLPDASDETSGAARGAVAIL